jgi:hypothetical protein
MTLRDYAFTPSGDEKRRLLLLLELARDHARLAQGGAGPRVQDALTELEHP